MMPRVRSTIRISPRSRVHDVRRRRLVVLGAEIDRDGGIHIPAAKRAAFLNKVERTVNSVAPECRIIDVSQYARRSAAEEWMRNGNGNANNGENGENADNRENTDRVAGPGAAREGRSARTGTNNQRARREPVFDGDDVRRMCRAAHQHWWGLNRQEADDLLEEAQEISFALDHDGPEQTRTWVAYIPRENDVRVELSRESLLGGRRGEGMRTPTSCLTIEEIHQVLDENPTRHAASGCVDEIGTLGEDRNDALGNPKGSIEESNGESCKVPSGVRVSGESEGIVLEDEMVLMDPNPVGLADPKRVMSPLSERKQDSSRIRAIESYSVYADLPRTDRTTSDREGYEEGIRHLIDLEPTLVGLERSDLDPLPSGGMPFPSSSRRAKTRWLYIAYRYDRAARVTRIAWQVVEPPGSVDSVEPVSRRSVDANHAGGGAGVPVHTRNVEGRRHESALVDVISSVAARAGADVLVVAMEQPWLPKRLVQPTSSFRSAALFDRVLALHDHVRYCGPDVLIVGRTAMPLAVQKALHHPARSR